MKHFPELSSSCPPLLVETPNPCQILLNCLSGWLPVASGSTVWLFCSAGLSPASCPFKQRSLRRGRCCRDTAYTELCAWCSRVTLKRSPISRNVEIKLLTVKYSMSTKCMEMSSLSDQYTSDLSLPFWAKNWEAKFRDWHPVWCSEMQD